MGLYPKRFPTTMKFLKEAVADGHKPSDIVNLLKDVMKAEKGTNLGETRLQYQKNIQTLHATYPTWLAYSERLLENSPGSTVTQVREWTKIAGGLSEQQKEVFWNLEKTKYSNLERKKALAKSLKPLDGKRVGLLGLAVREEDNADVPYRNRAEIKKVIESAKHLAGLEDHQVDLLERVFVVNPRTTYNLRRDYNRYYPNYFGLTFDRISSASKALKPLSKMQTEYISKLFQDPGHLDVYSATKSRSEPIDSSPQVIKYIQKVGEAIKDLSPHHIKHLPSSTHDSVGYIRERADEIRGLNNNQIWFWDKIRYHTKDENNEAVLRRIRNNFDVVSGIIIPEHTRYNSNQGWVTDDKLLQAARSVSHAVASFGDEQLKMAAKQLQGAKPEKYTQIINKIERIGEGHLEGAKAALKAGVPFESNLFAPAAKAITRGNIDEFEKGLFKYHKKTLNPAMRKELQRRFPAR